LSGIFISYRRSDNPDATGRIYDRLVAEFGKAQVFKDVDSIPLGQDFRGHLNDIVAHCGVMLAIVGPGWMDARNAAGKRRLDEADDFVRIELEAALARDIPVVPVLVGHAPIPLASELPESLASMAFRQSINVRPDPDFHNDVTKLVGAMRGILGPDAPRPEQPVSSKAAASRSRMWMGVCAALAVVAAALALPALKHLRETPAPETRLDIVTPATDNPESFALSPDGRRIVFVANVDGTPRLWLRSLGSATGQPLAGTDGARNPFWSPDSRSIAFFTVGSLKQLDLDGGQPQVLAAVTSTDPHGTWGAQGDILFSAGANEDLKPLSRVAAKGGAVTSLPLMGENASGNLFPVFLPDGEHFLFRSPTLSGAYMYLASLNGSPVKELLNFPQAAVALRPMAYLPSGWVLWMEPGNALMAQHLDEGKGALVGEPVKLADDVINVSAASNGAVAYRTTSRGLFQLTWVDRSGKVLGTIGSPDSSLNAPAVSKDGRRIAYSRETQGRTDIWIQDDTRSSRLALGNQGGSYPVWSPDGSRLAFVPVRLGGNEIFQVQTSGGQSQESLLKAERPVFPMSWSADGKYLLYMLVKPDLAFDLWVLPLETREPYPLLQSPFRKPAPKFSPDGKWVAYTSNESGRFEVYVRPFVEPGRIPAATPDAQWQVSIAGGDEPRWSRDGKELFFRDPAGTMMMAPMSFAGSSAAPGAPVALFDSGARGSGSLYDVAPDGRFLINRELDTNTAPITLIQNWNPDAAQ